MMDMIAMAFQSDTTRIATFMFGNAVSNVSFRFLEGVSAGHHDVSHHPKDADKLRQYQLINQWHVEQYAYLLRKLQSMKEGDSNVLDNSMVLFSSALSDGNSHDPHDCRSYSEAKPAAASTPGSTLPTAKTVRSQTSMYRCWMHSARRWSGSRTAQAS